MPDPVVIDSATTQPSVDGRSTRWDLHRANRRRELVAATLRTIREHGAGVGMDEIASSAATSKTVFYRHFGDRRGLWEAVVESVHGYILGNLSTPLQQLLDDPVGLVLGLADAYLGVVERDPEIYRFVTTRPDPEAPDPVVGFTGRIGTLVADALRPHMVRDGFSPEAAETWGQGVVGFIWAIAEQWMTAGMARPRAALVADVGDLVRPAFAPITGAPQLSAS